MQFRPQVEVSVIAPPAGCMAITLVGTGASSGIPIIGHIDSGCACEDAMEDPQNNPNNRGNVSLLITVPYNANSKSPKAKEKQNEESTMSVDQETGKQSHSKFDSEFGNQINGKPVRFTLIDCGKTFRDVYFKVLARHYVRQVDALLLTHDHADAIMGLDDLRDLQPMHMEEGDWFIDKYIPTFLLAETLNVIKKSFGYIFTNSQVVGSAPENAVEHNLLLSEHMEQLCKKGKNRWNNIGIRRSTALQFFVVPHQMPTRLYIPALCSDDDTGTKDTSIPMYSLPVEHGENYISLGYVFGRGTAFKSPLVGRRTESLPVRADSTTEPSCVVYISDVTSIPEPSMRFLLDLVKIDVLIIDCVHGPGKKCLVHITMDEMTELVAQLKPRYAIAVGMFCDIKHGIGNVWLQESLDKFVCEGRLQAGEVLGMWLGYDGMSMILPQ